MLFFARAPCHHHPLHCDDDGDDGDGGDGELVVVHMSQEPSLAHQFEYCHSALTDSDSEVELVEVLPRGNSATYIIN